MKRIYLIAASLVLLFFLCDVGSALAEGRPFITKWEGKKDKEILIPIVGTYKMLITDANGQEKVNETVTVKDEHSPYIFKPSEDGIYTVTAGPEGIKYFRTVYKFMEFKELLEVVQFGTVEWTSMEAAFRRCSRMTFSENIDIPNLSGVTNMENMFRECKAFNSPLERWDVSHVTNMSMMFFGCTLFNQSLTDWDVSHVTDMQHMFRDCAAFNQLLKWDVSNVTGMCNMFAGCTSFNQLLDWDVSKVTDMGGMFYGCTSFNQPLSWDVSNVTDMSYMFFSSTYFNQPLNWNVSNVTNMSSMFGNCIHFNQPLNWDVSKVTRMDDMFLSCFLFNQPLDWDVSKVTRMDGMFINCYKFNQPLNWDVSNVTKMDRMFFDCKAFNQSLGSWKIKTAVGRLNHTKMNVENFSKTLVGWAEWAKKADIRDIHFGDDVKGLVYNAKGKAARAELIKLGWTFEDDIEQTFEVMLVQPEHGTLTIEGYTTETLKKVSDDTELTVTATTTEEGYEPKEIQVNGKKIAGTTFRVTENTTVTAVFGLKTFPVTASVKDGKGGTVKLEGAANLDAVEYGTTLTVVATPDEANGYNKLKAVTVNGTPLAEGVMTFVVKEAKTVEVEFALKTFPVTKELKGVTKGEITITGATNLEAVEYGTELTVEGATTTEEGYEPKEIQVNGKKIAGTMFRVTENTTVTAVFGLKTFPVTASVKDGKGGTVKLEGAANLDAVEYGTTLTVVATPDEANGYNKLKAVTVNGTPLAEGVMTFVVKEAKTVEVEFALKTFPVTKELKGVTKGEITITGATNLDAVEYGTELTVEATTT
ncbi:MAG: BspA family leucine-rich repeat surface protein, partial [Bacteroides sp.]